MSRKRILVVANRTVDSPDLIAALRERGADTPVSITLLVPAVPHGLAWAADMKAGASEASRRAEAGVGRMREAGLVVEAVVIGDPDPFAATADALLLRRYDELVVSTLPRGVSRWLRLSLPDRLRRAIELPVTHVIARPRASSPANLTRVSLASPV